MSRTAILEARPTDLENELFEDITDERLLTLKIRWLGELLEPTSISMEVLGTSTEVDDALPFHLATGRVLPGDYEIVKTLVNAGGCFNRGISIVKHQPSGETRLCKALRIRDSYTETHLLARLNGHPNITRFFDGVTDLHSPDVTEHISKSCEELNCKGKDYDRIFLEYCDGGSLEALLDNSNSIPEPFILHVLEDLAKALRYCHTGRRKSSDPVNEGWDPIIHRDIIPSNIFFAAPHDSSAQYPRVVLGDFGCAFEKSKYVYGGQFHFDLPPMDIRFAAPESRVAHLEHSDIFALGLVIFTLCYDIRIKAAVPRKILSITDAEVDSGLWLYSRRLGHLVTKRMEFVPEDRPTADEIIAEVQIIRQELGRVD